MILWIDEALELRPAGMPADSFSLIFDAPPTDLQVVFDLLKRDALWQDALEECYIIKLVKRQPDNAFENSRTHYCHISDNFVRNMTELVEGPTSLIHFDAL